MKLRTKKDKISCKTLKKSGITCKITDIQRGSQQGIQTNEIMEENMESKSYLVGQFWRFPWQRCGILKYMV